MSNEMTVYGKGDNLALNFQYKKENTDVFEDLKTFERDGLTWFSVMDICSVLEIENVSDALSKVDEFDIDEIEKSSTADMSKKKKKEKIQIVNESGAYNIIFQSDKPEAKRFKRWITQEVIPSIRKKGFYGEIRTTPLFVRRFNEN